MISREAATRLLDMAIDAGQDELPMFDIESGFYVWSIEVLDFAKRKGQLVALRWGFVI